MFPFVLAVIRLPIELAVVVAMIGLNAVFAAYEIALASVSEARLHALQQEGRRSARTALLMKREMERSLAVVQLGITLVGVIAGAASGAGAETDIEPLLANLGIAAGWRDFLALVLVVIPLTAVTIVVGELVPKLFALKHKERVCLELSPAMHFMAQITWPVVWLLETSASGIVRCLERLRRPASQTNVVSEAAELQELSAIAALARTARLIGATEERIIIGAARLSSRPVREIVLPAEHVSLLNLNDSIGDCLIAAHLDMHTRFPVTAVPRDPQHIVGYVTFKDIVSYMKLNPLEPSMKSIVRNLLTVTDDLPIAAVLEQLMREHAHIALVRDGTSRVLGIVTLEDIIEELIGDIQDEYDLLPVHAVKSGSGWVVGGGISLARLKEQTGLTLEVPADSPEIHHLNGWVTAKLKRAPCGGEVVLENCVRVLVRKVRRQRVLEADISDVRRLKATKCDSK